MRSRLTHLSLDGNQVGDTVIQEVCSTICHLKTMQVVNFSKCACTDFGAFHIASLLTNSYLKIRALILHWNQIRGRGAEALAQAVR
jgi:Ran GTPase-activating protein (RanGAP) involved in mRNA processing and transport